MTFPEDIANHLRRSEEALLDPAVRSDRKRVAELLADDFVEFGSSGRIWARDEILDLLASETQAPIHMTDYQCEYLRRTWRWSHTAPRAQTPGRGSKSQVCGVQFGQRNREGGVCAFTRGRERPELRVVLLHSYTSRRLKMSSFSRHGHLEQPRQQTSRIATPAVAITARRLPLVISQCKTVCIEHAPESYKHRCRLRAVSMSLCQNLQEVSTVYH
jgi:hypothetical protein